MTSNDNYRLIIPHKNNNNEAAALFNKYFQYCTGENKYTPDSVLATWEEPRFDLEEEARIVVDEEGKWIAYGAVFNTEPPYAESIIVFRIDPDYLNRGVGTLITDWAEQKALENIKKAPPKSQVVLRGSNFMKMESSSDFMVSRGFSLNRYYFRMAQSLPASQALPKQPEGIRIEPFTLRQNLKELIDCSEECMLDHWNWWTMPDDELWEDWNHRIKSNPHHDPANWLLAMDGENLIGLCLTDSGTPGDPESAYIELLCIKKEYRKRGIASYLLGLALSESMKRKKKRITLHVDGSSLTGATRVYEQAGFKVDQTRMMFNKIIREGQE